MPMNAMRRSEPLLERLIRQLKPTRIIAETGRGDRASYYRNFKGHRVDKFGRPRLVKIARKELYVRENEFWAQLLIILWNEAMKPLYAAMRDKVATLDEDVEKVAKVDDEVAHKWIDELLEDHALEDILTCVYLNEVRFTDKFIRERLEAPLDISRDPEDIMGADAYVPEDEDEEAAGEEAAADDEGAAEGAAE